MTPPAWALARKDFGDRIALVVPLTFGRARITLGFDLESYSDSW